jgi:hypothetical protein
LLTSAEIRGRLSDSVLIVRCASLLLVLRIGLRLASSYFLLRLAAAHHRCAVSRDPRRSVERVTWAVTVAGKFVPATTCLTRAMAAQWILGRSGHSTRLRIGVRLSGNERLEAHAWLEECGIVVLGDANDLSSFTRVPLPEEIG